MEPSKDTFRLTVVVSDKEITDRIYTQCCSLMPSGYLPSERCQRFFSAVMEVMKKLERAKYHADRCKLLARQPPASPLPAGPHLVHGDQTTGVEAEVEAFLFQAKSTLDLLCRVLAEATGIKARTFGPKGEKVTNALLRNVGKERQQRAADLIGLIEGDQGWLGRMVELRDEVTHSRALQSSGVQIRSVGDAIIVTEPMDGHGMPFSQTVATLYFNLLTFCEDFVALTLGLSMPSGLGLRVVGRSDRADTAKPKYEVVAYGPGVG
jgi:hypothetical protein